ncbi:recombinase family protein [Pseudomonas gregormendelii]
MPKAISYIRFSTGKQAKGNSEERQEQAVTRWLIANSTYTRSDLEYKDLGKSGYHSEHTKEGGGWAMLLEAVEAGHIQSGDVVLVEAMDRTGRLPHFKMMDVIRPVLEAGIAIVTLDDGNRFDEASLEGSHIYLLVAKIQAAHGYSKTLSERTKASYALRKEKAKNGEGVKRYTPVWLEADGTPIPDIVPHIQQVFDLYISGVGKHTIANRLRATGEPKFATTVGSTVGKWINNKSAIGYWNDIPNVYPSVVTPEVFYQAQKRQKEVKTTPKTYTSKNFLVGLVKCGVCGSNYSIHRKDGKIHNMRCREHHLQGDARCANNETIPYQVVHCLYLESAYAWIDKAMKTVRLSDNAKRKIILTTEREELTASIKRLVRLSAKQESEEVEAEYQLANDRRSLIDDELSILERTVDDGKSEASRFFLYYEAITEHDHLAFTDPVKLSALLKQAGYSITIQPGKKLYLPYDNVPWVYTGVVRKGNTTLGYRVVEDQVGFVISNIIPSAVDVHKYDKSKAGESAHLIERSYSYITPPTLLATGRVIRNSLDN